jgi:hypothetical protein
MTEIADSLRVAAPQLDVWRAIEAQDQHARWHPFATAIKGVHALGEVRECDILVGGKPGTTRETCTAYDPGRAISWRIDADSSGFSKLVHGWTSGFRLQHEQDSTVITAWSDFRPKWFVRPMLPMIKRKFHQTQQQILDALRRHVEAA